MKRNIIVSSFTMLVVFFITSVVYAQEPLPCGNYKIDKIAEGKAIQFLLKNKTKAAKINLVRVYFHIVTNDDGSNAAVTTDQIAAEYAILQQSYAADNICFLNAGTNIVKNTFLNTLFNAINDPEGTFFSPYQVPNCINIFYTQRINGDNPACKPPCGIGGVALGGIPG